MKSYQKFTNPEYLVLLQNILFILLMKYENTKIIDCSFTIKNNINNKAFLEFFFSEAPQNEMILEFYIVSSFKIRCMHCKKIIIF